MVEHPLRVMAAARPGLQGLRRWLRAFWPAWLVAPLGASAVLVFAVPASPLAQPWSAVSGNTLSTLVGVACVLAIPDPVAAAAVAVALAIGVMFALRCPASAGRRGGAVRGAGAGGQPAATWRTCRACTSAFPARRPVPPASSRRFTCRYRGAPHYADAPFFRLTP